MVKIIVTSGLGPELKLLSRWVVATLKEHDY